MTTFLPAMCTIPIWLAIAIRENVDIDIDVEHQTQNGQQNLLLYSTLQYYPLAIAMIFGSMIAGSTPLGGGVVAFPVSVLVLGFRPSQGRDFSLAIQSVGMTAASYVILTKKRHLFKGQDSSSSSTSTVMSTIVSKFCVFSIIGLIIGFEALDVYITPYVVNLINTTIVTSFVIVLAYSDYSYRNRRNRQQLLSPLSSSSILIDSTSTTEEKKEKRQKNVAEEPTYHSGDSTSSIQNNNNNNDKIESSSLCYNENYEQTIYYEQEVDDDMCSPRSNAGNIISIANSADADARDHVGSSSTTKPLSYFNLSSELLVQVKNKEIITSKSERESENQNEQIDIKQQHLRLRTRLMKLERIRLVAMNWIILPIFAIAGGILSSQIGTGADIACFAYCSFFYNDVVAFSMGVATTTTSRAARMGTMAFTAMSVIVMANTSIFGTILRITAQQQQQQQERQEVNTDIAVTKEVYCALVACTPIVVLGAPLGSLFLTETNQRRLKRLFYVLGVLQLLIFGVIKIGNDVVAWGCVIGVIVFTGLSIFIHHRYYHQCTVELLNESQPNV